MNKTLNQKQIKTIQNFWKWVEDNQTTIFNAYVLGINTQEVAMHFNRNLNYISKQIDCLIFYQDETLKLLFTAQGYRKLFPKLIALEENAPKLSRVTPIIFIKPITDENEKDNSSDGGHLGGRINVSRAENGGDSHKGIRLKNNLHRQNRGKGRECLV